MRESLIFVKAAASNVVAALAPRAYVRMTRQTGRGSEPETPDEIADYFWRCFRDYFERLGPKAGAPESYLSGKRVLEYGPGDVLGVALLFFAYGASRVDCVDRFPLENLSVRNERVYRCLIDRLDGSARARAEGAFREHGNPRSGFRPEAIEYGVTRSGLRGRPETYDLSISRAVLEHVNDLDATFGDITSGLKPGGASLHLVDLKSHGLDRRRRFDFLEWSDWAYRVMYGAKGVPNRWRVDKYRALVSESGLRLLELTPNSTIPVAEILELQPRLAFRFRSIDPSDLAWEDFWIVLERPG